MSMEPFCELCCINDGCCKMLGGEIPCARRGGCVYHLVDRGTLPRKVPDIKDVSDVTVTGAEMERWVMGRDSSIWGKSDGVEFN